MFLTKVDLWFYIPYLSPLIFIEIAVMRNLLFVFATILGFSSFAQTVEDDFEGNGTIESWVW